MLIIDKNPNKINYIYVLTPKGIAEKTKLTMNFMKRKMKEYDELKREIEKYASSSKDSDQEVYLELMKRLQNQSSSESLSQQTSKEDLKRKFEKGLSNIFWFIGI